MEVEHKHCRIVYYLDAAQFYGAQFGYVPCVCHIGTQRCFFFLNMDNSTLLIMNTLLIGSGLQAATCNAVSYKRLGHGNWIPTTNRKSG